MKKVKEIVTTSIPANIVHLKSLVVNLITFTQKNANLEIDVSNICVNLDTPKEIKWIHIYDKNVTLVISKQNLV